MTENPFFESWTTPFGMPPFDRIRPEHFPPAFDRGMQEQIGRNRRDRGFRRGAELCRHDRGIGAQRPVARAGQPSVLQPRCEQHRRRHRGDRSGLRAAARPAPDPHCPSTLPLFARIADLHARRASLGLDPDQLRLIERYYLRFVRSGALLNPAQKERMAAISERLASLHTLFGQNVLHDEQDWQLVLDETDLDGLPGFVKAAAAQAAEERGLAGRYAVTLSRSAVEPFLTFSSRRDLRRALWEAWTARGARGGASDNAPIIREILALRAEQARLLGYENFADYRLDDTMAKTSAAAERLLLQVWEPAKAKARDERAALEAVARARGSQRGDRALGLAVLRGEGPKSPVRPRRGGHQAVFRARQHGAGGIRHRRPPVRADLHRARRSPGLSSRCPGLGGSRRIRQSCRAFSCTTISPGPASSRAPGRAATAIRKTWTSRWRRSSSTTTISPGGMPGGMRLRANRPC